MELSTGTGSIEPGMFDTGWRRCKGYGSKLFKQGLSLTGFLTRQSLMIFFVIWCVPYLFDFGSNQIGCKVREMRTGVGCINPLAPNSMAQEGQHNQMLRIVTLLQRAETARL